MQPPTGGSASLDKGYEPAQVESHWAAFWEEHKLFHGENTSKKPAFSIVLPPPNVTGSLHIGHALTATIEDILIRWKRMSGFNVCWMPGIDHAGIATQMVVERDLKKKEGKSRHDLGRAEFLKRVWAWKEQSGGRISLQHRALGASLDWERERFTMDEQSSKAVREAFVRLHEDGLLYRAERLINWCPSCRTALSDLEVEYEEGKKAELYKFAYKLAAGQGVDGQEIIVATTRPETMLGDTAVAVHPDDPRYQHLIGKRLQHPFLERTFPIIGDGELVDPKFGTGAVKVTPAHSLDDFESGKRNKLEFINILNLDGTLNANAGKFQGKDRIAVRKELKEAIAALGLERGSDPHVMAIGKCQRCDSIVEPLLSKQWFVKTRPLADKVIAAVDAGKIEFQPENWKAEFYRWMRNIHDWCISRQLWWGHQIPAWTCVNDHITVARSTPAACGTCGSLGLAQDPDVLDTWFSSGLWPFSTFGWPEKTPQLATFYPNSVMETGFDILFFWVARMAMMGLHFLGEVPFKTVFLHAMVRDEKGEKMSKTRGNVIDPLDITSKYGADALRFTLASLAAQGRDIKLAVDRIQANKAFANKVWNAARYVLMYAEGHDANAPAAPATVYDRWILSRLQRCAEATNTALNEYRFSDAALGVYRFLWNELCDWAIELSKPALQAGKNDDGTPRALTAEEKRLKAGAVSSLLRALEGGLRLLHPFMPFVTEEIWQRLPKNSGAPVSIMVTEFPGRGKHDEALLDTAAESEMDLVARAIDGARSVRGEVNLPPNQAVPIVLVPKNAEVQKLFERHERAFQRLANATTVTLAGAGKGPKQAAVHVEPEVEVHLPLAGLIDFAEEGKRVEKELQRLAAEREGLEKRLGNEGFVARAPREVVEKDRARAEELRGRIEKLTRHRERVSSWETGMNGENKADGMNGHSGTQPAAAPAAPMAPAVEQVKHAAEEVGHKVAELASTVVHAAETGAKIAAEKAAEVAGEAMAAAKQAASDGAEKAQKAVKKAVAKGTSAAKKAAGKASKAIQAKAKPAKKAAKPAKKAAKKAAKPAKKAAKPAKKMAAKKGAAKKAAKPAKKAAKAKKPAKAAKKPAKKK